MTTQTKIQTAAPWTVNRAIFDPDSEDVAYILEGVKYACAPDARLVELSPRLRDVLKALVLAIECGEKLDVVHRLAKSLLAELEGEGA